MSTMLSVVKSKKILFAILVLGFALRLILVGTVHGDSNLNQDEAFAAYEAYSISTYGVDSHGYHNPVYLVAWGSGMNALETYFMIPYIKIFGLNSLSVRLPQALMGCITLIFIYLMSLKLFDEKNALWACFVITFSPWHIMMSRWGLESNFIIGFLTIAVYFLVSADHKKTRIILAAVFMGLTLYCYSAVWIVLPVLVIGILVYLVIEHKINVKEIVIYLLILTVIAIPLLLFVAVNYGMIQEVRSFISIPKLSYFRNGEIKFSVDNVKNTFNLLWNQYDGYIWNGTEKFGLFFHFSKVFFALGMFSLIKNRSKKAIPVVIWFLAALIHSFSLSANVNRINILFVPVACIIGCGINFFLSLIVESSRKQMMAGVLVIYAFSIFFFTQYYFTDYNAVMKDFWSDGIDEALAAADELTDGTIHIKNGDVYYPLVLFYEKYPSDIFFETVVYENPNAIYLSASSFDGFTMTDFTRELPVSGDVYICNKNNSLALSYIEFYGMEQRTYGNYIVGVRR